MLFFKVVSPCVLFVTLSVSFSVLAGFREGVREAILENGLKVILLEDHRSPLAILQVWYKAGSRNEQLGQTGISHLLEHMMFKGTRKVAPEEFSRIIERNGGNVNAFTMEDATVYFEKLAADRIDVALELEADRMVNLSMDFKQFDEERKVVIEERRLRTEDDPASALHEQVSAVAFQAHPYQWPIIGWMEDLVHITSKDLAEYYKNHYHPNNAFLIIGGDFSPDRMLERVRYHFAPIPKGPDPPLVRSREPVQQGERRLVLKRPAELPLIVIGYHIPNIKSKDAYALLVLSTILAGGKSSRLYRDLVDRQRLALQISVGYDPLTRDPTLFVISAQVMPGKEAHRVEKGIEQEIEKMKRGKIAEVELKRAKKQIEAEFVFGQDSLFGRAMLLGQYELSGQWNWVDEYLPNIQAVSANDVRRVVEQYLSSDHRTVGRLVPLPSTKERTKKSHSRQRVRTKAFSDAD
jgi:zinc protease